VHEVWMSMTSASPPSATLTVVIQARPDFGSVLAIDKVQLGLPASPTTDSACPGAEHSNLRSMSTADVVIRGHFAPTHLQTSNWARRRLAEECAGHRSDARTTRRTVGVLDLGVDGWLIALSEVMVHGRTHGSSPVYIARHALSHASGEPATRPERCGATVEAPRCNLPTQRLIERQPDAWVWSHSCLPTIDGSSPVIAEEDADAAGAFAPDRDAAMDDSNRRCLAAETAATPEVPMIRRANRRKRTWSCWGVAITRS